MEHLPEVVNDTVLQADLENQCGIAVHTNVPRQQIINSPCPICGDKITGYHYGIFSCESCKGFFKRSVQNRKNYTCLRSGTCSVNISTRKKCAACRYNKCLQHGMRIEAIREDRTRGGRSTYPCAFPSPAAAAVHSSISNVGKRPVKTVQIGDSSRIRSAPSASALSSNPQVSASSDDSSGAEDGVPKLIQEIMAVEPLWHQSEGDDSQELMLSEQTAGGDGLTDHRLYRIVKWCKSLPLFKNIQIDDQICLLLNSWCELLLLSCCYRSIPCNNELRLSGTKTLNLDQGRNLGLGVIIERMLNLTDHLRRMKLDEHEYVCLKVVILLNSDVPGISEPGQVRSSQEKVIQSLQAYTLSHYPSHPSKFGELLLRIPELQRTCQIGKESLVMKQRDGEVPGFNLLLELLQADQSEQVDEIVTK